MIPDIEYDPWEESHAPKNFKRTDPTGRYLPIVSNDEVSILDQDTVISRILLCVAGMVCLILLYLALHVEMVA